MKTTVFCTLIAGFIFLSFSCNNDSDQLEKKEKENESLYAIGTRAELRGDIMDNDNANPDSSLNLIFSGDDLVSFNVKTREIVFTDAMINKLSTQFLGLFSTLTLYFNDKPLLDSISIVPVISSRLHNDLVFVVQDFKFYLEDGYPKIQDSWPNEDELQTIRKENAQKRKTEWETFMKYLNDSGKIIE